MGLHLGEEPCRALEVLELHYAPVEIEASGTGPDEPRRAQLRSDAGRN